MNLLKFFSCKSDKRKQQKRFTRHIVSYKGNLIIYITVILQIAENYYFYFYKFFIKG